MLCNIESSLNYCGTKHVNDIMSLGLHIISALSLSFR